MTKTAEVFYRIYKKEAEKAAFTPYRVCPIGAHSDHQLGKITGLAIDKGIHMAYGPKQNGVVELRSLQFEKRCQFHILSVPKEKEGDWADYLRGATLALGARYSLHTGLCGVDAPGSFIAWLCKRSKVFAMKMPGERFDIGTLENYEKIKKEYVGIC